MKYGDNSFRNGEFHVPLRSGTGPERERNRSEIGTPKKVVSGQWLMADVRHEMGELLFESKRFYRISVSLSPVSRLLSVSVLLTTDH